MDVRYINAIIRKFPLEVTLVNNLSERIAAKLESYYGI